MQVRMRIRTLSASLHLDTVLPAKKKEDQMSALILRYLASLLTAFDTRRLGRSTWQQVYLLQNPTAGMRAYPWHPRNKARHSSTVSSLAFQFCLETRSSLKQTRSYIELYDCIKKMAAWVCKVRFIDSRASSRARTSVLPRRSTPRSSPRPAPRTGVGGRTPSPNPSVRNVSEF